jgi:hypothetical protein
MSLSSCYFLIIFLPHFFNYPSFGSLCCYFPLFATFCTVVLPTIVGCIFLLPLRWFVVCRGFTILLRHTILGRTPLEEWSARSRDFYPTTQNSQKIQASMPLAGLEPAFPASERTQTLALNPAVTGTCTHVCMSVCYSPLFHSSNLLNIGSFVITFLQFVSCCRVRFLIFTIRTHSQHILK